MGTDTRTSEGTGRLGRFLHDHGSCAGDVAVVREGLAGDSVTLECEGCHARYSYEAGGESRVEVGLRPAARGLTPARVRPPGPYAPRRRRRAVTRLRTAAKRLARGSRGFARRAPGGPVSVAAVLAALAAIAVIALVGGGDAAGTSEPAGDAVGAEPATVATGERRQRAVRLPAVAAAATLPSGWRTGPAAGGSAELRGPGALVTIHAEPQGGLTVGELEALAPAILDRERPGGGARRVRGGKLGELRFAAVGETRGAEHRALVAVAGGRLYAAVASLSLPASPRARMELARVLRGIKPAGNR